MINRVILVGHLGKDPEVRTTNGGQVVATFSMATSRRWKDRDGNKQEQTEWHSIVVWGKLAEIVGKYLTKGKLIYCEGRIQTRSWEKDGEKKYRTEIVMENMQMLGGGGGKKEERREEDGGGWASEREKEKYAEPGEDDDDIPF